MHPTSDGHLRRGAPGAPAAASDEQFRTLVEAGADAVLVVSAWGTIVYANPAAGALLGRPHADLVGQEFGVPVVVGETTEVDLRRADGAERVAEMRAVASTWCGAPVHLASLRDVTDRKRAEDAARAATDTLRSFYDTTPMMMGVAELVGADVLFVSANAATARFFGVPAEGIAGKCAGTLGSPRAVLDRWGAAYREAERTGTAVRFEYERAAPHGSVWLSATLGLIDRARNGHPRFSFVVEDATARKRTESALAEAGRRKDEFLAMLAHELRNPLAPIRNAVYVLKAHTAPSVPGRDTLDMMDRQIHHMARLLDDLLDVSRVAHGTIRLQKEPLDARDVVARAVETAGPLIDARNHHLTIETEPGPHPIHGDLARLVQVVSNLLINAAKYTPDGGRIVLTLRREGTDAVFRVRDNGTGIQPELLMQLFEPFSQGARTLARSEGGLGLGLALVRSLTELHGGTVHGTSEGPGCGAEFEVRVPLTLPRASPAPPAEGAAGEAAIPLRVLVVDDNRDAADSLAMLLELYGHAVETAYDGPSGVESARRARPDLVFLDIGLPGMDGYAVAARLRAAPEMTGTRIVALSGYAQEEDRQRSRAAGFDDHLVKPLDPDTLARCLSEAAALRSAR
jgi:PAS domain S-box-containing protein